MSNPNSQGKPPKFQPSKDYEKIIQLQLKYLPQQVQAELASRAQYDPQFIEQALGLQHAYDPALAGEQIAAWQRRDPYGYAVHQGMGQKVQDILERGYIDPRQEAAYAKMAGLAGKLDPEQEAAYRKAGLLAGRGEPQREAAYKALGSQVTGDTLRGGTASPDVLRQIQQGFEGRASGNPLLGGEAPMMAQGVYTGQRLEDLKRQRQQATGQFLQQTTPTSEREASLRNFYSMPGLNQLRQAGLGQFYGQQSPLLGALGVGGTYGASRTPMDYINSISGVTPPRAFGYVDPQAGNRGLELGLQSQQFQYANQALSGGGGNPWTNALSGAAQGANYGSIGGGYGMAGGAITGGILGAFGYPQYSDEKGKKNVSRTGLETPDGIPIVEFSYKNSDKRYRGVVAQDVEKIRPDAVHHFSNGHLGVFYSRLGIELKEVE